MNKELAEELAREFEARGYQWVRDGVHFTPTVEDFVEALAALKIRTPDNHYLVGGRLVVVNSDGHRDVYMHIGEIE